MTYSPFLGEIENIAAPAITRAGTEPSLLGSGRDVPIDRFQPVNPPVPGSVPSQILPGTVFFSPAPFGLNAGAEMDLASVVVATRPADRYFAPIGQTKTMLRPFILGPAPSSPSGRAWPPDFSASYEPALNDGRYGLMSNKGGSAVCGTLVNTSTMETEIVLV